MGAGSRTFHDCVDGTLLLPGSCTCAKVREEVRSNPLTEGTQRNMCTKKPPCDLPVLQGPHTAACSPSPPARRQPTAACSSTTGCRPSHGLQWGCSSELAPACEQEAWESHTCLLEAGARLRGALLGCTLLHGGPPESTLLGGALLSHSGCTWEEGNQGCEH